jgi:hypothetical protein
MIENFTYEISCDVSALMTAAYIAAPHIGDAVSANADATANDFSITFGNTKCLAIVREQAPNIVTLKTRDHGLHVGFANLRAICLMPTLSQMGTNFRSIADRILPNYDTSSGQSPDFVNATTPLDV